jgi:hypothetical protein
MKLNTIIVRNLTVIISVIIFSGCSSSRKTATTEKSTGKVEFVSFENNVIKDPVAKYTWSYFNDNPTTYFRYKLNSSGNPASLPTMDQILAFLEKISLQINMKKDPGNISIAGWFGNDCDFLSSSLVRTTEGEVFYEVAHWDAKAKSAKKGMVTGGDLVYILVLKEN